MVSVPHNLLDLTPLRPHQGVGAELVRDALPNTVALDDVAGLDVIRENDLLVPDDTARFLDRGYIPLSVSLARPEREARSVWTIEQSPV